MKIRFCIIFGILLVWNLVSHSKLNSALKSVENSEHNLEISTQRHDDILEKYTDTLNEIAKYNRFMSENNSVIVDLTKQLEMYEVEFVGCKNRVSVSKNELAKSIMEYNTMVDNFLFIIPVVLFGYKRIEYGSLSMYYTKDYQLYLVGRE